MCSFYVRGMCTKGEDCNFAHGNQEMKPIPDLNCTRWCPVLLRQGYCSNRTTCTFAHRRQELRPFVSHKAEAAEGGKWDEVSPVPSLGGSAGSVYTPSTYVEQFTTTPGSSTDSARMVLASQADSRNSRFGLASEAFKVGLYRQRPAGGTLIESTPVTDSDVQMPFRPSRRFAMGKTRMCRFNMQGNCRHKDKCRFAHEYGELKSSALGMGLRAALWADRQKLTLPTPVAGTGKSAAQDGAAPVAKEVNCNIGKYALAFFHISVKHTFLHVEPKSAHEDQGLKRSSSAPCF